MNSHNSFRTCGGVPDCGVADSMIISGGDAIIGVTPHICDCARHRSTVIGDNASVCNRKRCGLPAVHSPAHRRGGEPRLPQRPADRPGIGRRVLIGALQPGRRPPQTLRATADAARSRLHHPISSRLDRRVRRHAQRCRLAVSSSARDDHARPATSSLASGPIRSWRAFLRLLRLLGRRRTRHLPVGVQHPPSQRRVLTRVPMHHTLHLTGRPTPTRLDRLHHHPR